MLVFASADQVVPNIAPSGTVAQMTFWWAILCPSFLSFLVQAHTGASLILELYAHMRT